MSPDSQWSQADHVLVTDLPDGLVLMDSHQGRMFSLNSTGRFIWHLLPATRPALTAQLQATYGLPGDLAQRDTDQLLDHLCTHGLIHEVKPTHDLVQSRPANSG
jgi:hypothetical protein